MTAAGAKDVAVPEVVAKRGKTPDPEWRRVTNAWKHQADKLAVVEFYAEGDAERKTVETLSGTVEHPFFTGAGQVAMADLGIGTAILTRVGPRLVVKSVRIEAHPEGVWVYNCTVEGDHTFYVGTASGGAWVHNGECKGIESSNFADDPLARVLWDARSANGLTSVDDLLGRNLIAVEFNDGTVRVYANSGKRGPHSEDWFLTNHNNPNVPVDAVNVKRVLSERELCASCRSNEKMGGHFRDEQVGYAIKDARNNRGLELMKYYGEISRTGGKVRPYKYVPPGAH